MRSGSPVPVNASDLPPPGERVLAARDALAFAVDGRLSFEPLDRLSYARDLWPLALLWIRQGKSPPPPDAVAWPGSEDEVVSLVRLARERQLPLVPFGAGSGVCGGTWAVAGGVMVDVKRLDAIGEVDARTRTVEVGAGVLGETLERQLASRGWTLGHFPSSIAMSTVGGWLATRSAGQLSSKYGKIEDLVLSVDAVTGAAERLRTPARPFAGPDLQALLLGSEGTLCCFTRARLRVSPAPAGRAFHGFDFRSVGQGLEAIRAVLREGLRPAAVRLYDPFDTAFVAAEPRRRKPEAPPSSRGGLPRQLLRFAARQTLGRPRALNALQGLLRKSRLVLVFEGEAERARAEDRAAAILCREQGGVDLGEGPGRAWLERRYAVSFKMSGLIDAGTFADTMEVAAPWERVEAIYEAVHRAASPWAFVLCHFSHAYPEGCSLYFSFVGSGGDEEELEGRYHQLWRAALGAALAAGGNVSHHHGVGLLKAEALQQSLGEGRAALAALKARFDPGRVLNPGKLGLAAGPAAEAPAPPAAPALRPSGAGALQAALGPACRPGPQGLTWTPPDVRALQAGLKALASQGASLGREVHLDRSALASCGEPRQASMTVEVGAGLTLAAVEAALAPAGLSLGPLSPGAWALTVAAFLEGRHAGLRAVAPGRLEPLCLALGAVLPGGQRLDTPGAPRSAAGPDLGGLVLGGEGRLALAVSATLRCQPRPQASGALAVAVDGAAAAVELVRRFLTRGAVPSRVRLWPSPLVVELAWEGSVGSVARDLELARRVGAELGTEAAPPAPVPLPPREREARWEAVEGALAGGAALALHRLSLASVVALGPVEGLALDEAGAWSPAGAALAPLGSPVLGAAA